jgi:hypothetical protein
MSTQAVPRRSTDVLEHLVQTEDGVQRLSGVPLDEDVEHWADLILLDSSKHTSKSAVRIGSDNKAPCMSSGQTCMRSWRSGILYCCAIVAVAPFSEMSSHDSRKTARDLEFWVGLSMKLAVSFVPTTANFLRSCTIALEPVVHTSAAFLDDGLNDDVIDHGIDDGLDYDLDDDGIDGEGELRYEMLWARNRQKVEYAGAKMMISMMVSMRIGLIRMASMIMALMVA